MTSVRTGPSESPISVSAVAAVLRLASSLMPRKPRPAAVSAPHPRVVLADAAGKDQDVQAVHGRRHGRDLPAEPVHVDIDRELGRPVGRRLRRRSTSRSRRTGGSPARPASPASCSSPADSSSRLTLSCCESQRSSPGSTLPLRVAITRPSSGVKPIVVSMLRPPGWPPATPPPPRWQLTIRRSVSSRPSNCSGAAGGVLVRQTVKSVPPQTELRVPLGRAARNGRRHQEASRGRRYRSRPRRVRWAAAWRPPRCRRWPAAGAGREAGERPDPGQGESSISTGPVNRLPPWTTRWPTIAPDPWPQESREFRVVRTAVPRVQLQ